MTLEETIKSTEKLAKLEEENLKKYSKDLEEKERIKHLRSIEVHKQLTEWLKELKTLREEINNIRKEEQIKSDKIEKINKTFGEISEEIDEVIKEYS